MSDSGAGGGCCRCCCSFIITSGLTALFMWLSLRTSNPTLSVERLYAAALNATDTSPAARANCTVFLDVKLANNMKDKGVHYANTTLTLSFYRRRNSSTSDDDDLIPVGDYAWPGFYQGHKKSARRRAHVGAVGCRGPRPRTRSRAGKGWVSVEGGDEGQVQDYVLVHREGEARGCRRCSSRRHRWEG
ncbi:hypothetical protein SASPL_146276 [Salvia splendens]|uniref:Late embryogenesis abundant protein LEA-2 subgroup domain-containing protein n=1 Tax=Salvia splendens TaxID=180675 RepID=A0A8X8Z5L9_SALSN|nr:hypothetical protein SASPL_146276 [Salvia splendens]